MAINTCSLICSYMMEEELGPRMNDLLASSGSQLVSHRARFRNDVAEYATRYSFCFSKLIFTVWRMKDLEEEFKQTAINQAPPLKDENFTGYLPLLIPLTCHHIFPHTQECELHLFTIQISLLRVAKCILSTKLKKKKKNGMRKETVTTQLLNFLMNAANIVMKSRELELNCERYASNY